MRETEETKECVGETLSGRGKEREWEEKGQKGKRGRREKDNTTFLGAFVLLKLYILCILLHHWLLSL